MKNMEIIDIKAKFQEHYLPEEDDFDPGFKDHVVHLIEEVKSKQDPIKFEGTTVISLRDFQKDIDIITRNRLVKLTEIISSQFEEKVQFTDLNYSPDLCPVDLTGLDLKKRQYDLLLDVFNLFEEKGIMKDGKYTEPFLNHEKGIRIILNDVIINTPDSRLVIYELLALLNIKDNLIMHIGMLQWDQVLKLIYETKLRIVVEGFNSNKGPLGLLYCAAFGLKPGDPIITTVYGAEKYIHEQYQLSDFSYPAKVESLEGGNKLRVTIIESFLKEYREVVVEYDFSRFEINKGNAENIQNAIRQDIPLMVNMNNINSFLHPQSGDLLPSKLYKECKPLKWNQK